MGSLQLALLNSVSHPKQQHLIIKQNLATAIQCLGNPWRFVEPNQASNLLCVWIETPEDLPKLEAVEKLCPANRLIVLSAIKLQSQAHWQWLSTTKNACPSVLNLINILSRVQAFLLPDFPSNSVPFDPDHYFTGILQTVLADGVARVCSIPEQTAIYLLPKENTVYINGDMEKIIPLALSKSAHITVKNMTDHELLKQVNYVKFSSRLSDYANFLGEDLFEAAQTTQYCRYSFAEAIWFSTLIASQGNLLADATADETLTFPKLPDFINNHYSDLLADFFELERMTLAERLNANTEKSRYEQINFYNACLLLPDVQHKTTRQKYSFADLEVVLKELTQQLPESTILIVTGNESVGKSTLCNTLADSSKLPAESALKLELGGIQFGHSNLFLYQMSKTSDIDDASQVLCSNAWGLLVLINNADANPFMELGYYLEFYKSYFNQAKIAIGITHSDIAAELTLADYVSHLENLQCNYPVLAVNPSRLSDSIALLIALLKS